MNSECRVVWNTYNFRLEMLFLLKFMHRHAFWWQADQYWKTNLIWIFLQFFFFFLVFTCMGVCVCVCVCLHLHNSLINGMQTNNDQTCLHGVFHFLHIIMSMPMLDSSTMFIVLPNQTNFPDFIFWIYLSLQLIRILQNIFLCTHTWYVCIFKCFSWQIPLSCCYMFVHMHSVYKSGVYPRIILLQTDRGREIGRLENIDDIFWKYRFRLKSLYVV